MSSMSGPTGEPSATEATGTGASAPERDRHHRGLLTTRPNRATVLAGVLTLGLGLGISAQITHTRDLGLDSLRESELVSILDSVSQRSARLDAEARELETERARLAQDDAGGQEALDRAQRRVDDLGILAGTVPAQGPGVTTVIGGGRDVLGASSLLDLVQELRDAGAEAIQIGETRVVASTSFQDSGSDVLVDGTRVTWPLRVVAIGESRTLASALAIPGGVEETTRGAGASITVDPSERVVVNALHAPSAPRYARSVTPSPGHTTP